MSILTRMFLNLSGTFEEKKVKSDKFIENAFPIILKYRSSTEIITYGFAALSMTPEYSKEKLKSVKAIIGASVLLSLHLGEPPVAQNIIAFLYECAASGLTEEIKNNKAVLSTVFKAWQKFPQNQSIVERSIGLLCLCDYPDKLNLLHSVIIQFPESEFLKQNLQKFVH